MDPIKIDGHTRELKAPFAWDEEKHGKCLSLPIRDVADGSHNIMYSAWTPTKEELDALNRGCPVMLGIVGYSHPPVVVAVAAERQQSQLAQIVAEAVQRQVAFNKPEIQAKGVGGTHEAQ